MITVILGLLTLHFIVFRWLKNGTESILKSTLDSIHNSGIESEHFTVVVPFRNESDNLQNLIYSLKIQKSTEFSTQVIFVNDHSTDNSVSLLNDLLKSDFPFSYTIISLDEDEGKKNALLKAIKATNTKFIIQIDADVTLNENWLSTIINNTRDETDLLILPVQIQGKNLWFQEFEFSALQFITFGMGGNEVPILCNGANLLYRRSLWLDAFDSIRKGDSGDDVFLLQNFIENDRNINFANAQDLKATTAGQQGIRDFFHQRIRWAGKNQNVSIPKYKLTTLYLGVLQLLPFIICCIDWRSGLPFLLIKIAIDYYFLQHYRRSCGENTSFFHFILSALLMPVYLLSLVFLPFFLRPMWKGRNVNV